MAAMVVKFMTVTGQFKTDHEDKFPSLDEAKQAVTVYAQTHGFKNIKLIDDEGGYRVVATTPGGRHGRNIAFIEYDIDENDYNNNPDLLTSVPVVLGLLGIGMMAAGYYTAKSNTTSSKPEKSAPTVTPPKFSGSGSYAELNWYYGELESCGPHDDGSYFYAHMYQAADDQEASNKVGEGAPQPSEQDFVPDQYLWRWDWDTMQWNKLRAFSGCGL